ncbi:hypothetical protein ACK3F5_22945 [Photorhabdus asymbiotica UENP]
MTGVSESSQQSSNLKDEGDIYLCSSHLITSPTILKTPSATIRERSCS